MNIFILKDGNRQGPYSSEQLTDLIQRGHVSLSDPAQFDGSTEWTAISNLPGALNADHLPATENQNPISQSLPNAVEGAPQVNATKWYYLVGDKTCGPVTLDQIRNLIASGAIPNASYVFHEGMKDWAKAYSLPDFQPCNQR